MPTPVPANDLPENMGMEPVPADDLPDTASGRGGFFRKAPRPVSAPTNATPGIRDQLAGAVGGALSNPTVGAAALPIAAGALTAGAGAPIELGVAALAGGAQTIAQSVGEGKGLPPWKEVVKGAALNTFFQGAGEAVSAGIKAVKGAAEVASDFVGAGERSVLKTSKQVGAAASRRQLLIESGVSPEQATEIAANPVASAAYDRNIQYANDTKKWFQAAVDNKRAELTKTIDTAVGKYKGHLIGADPINAAITDALQRDGEQASPGLKRFLEQQQKGLTDELSSIPNAKVPPMSVTIDEAQRFNDQLWRMYPRGKDANAFDQRIITNLTKATDTQIESGLRTAGANSEQIASYKAARQDWGRFKAVVSTFDPRKPNFGTDVANALYDDLKGNPDQALYLARMVSAADKVNPGTRQQFATGFLEHFLGPNESGPIGQMQAFSKFRREFAASGTKGTGQAFLEEVFGKGSPMANETKFATIMGKLGDPKLVSAAQNGVRDTANFGNIQWIAKYAAILGGYHFLTGKKGGLFAAMTDPAGWAAIAGYMVSRNFATKMLSAGGPISTAYADFLLSGGSESSFQKFIRTGATVLGAGTTAVATSPSTQSPSSSVP